MHVLLAIVAVGFNASYGIWLAGAGQAPEHEGHVLRGIKRLDDRFANPAYVLLFVTGVVLVVRGHWGFATTWVSSAIVLYVVVAAIALLGYSPALRGQIEALEQTGARSPEYRAAAKRATVAGASTAVGTLVIVFLMVTKPGG
ncbi:MAG: hypothetical protein QOE35_1122 [Actinomycetota bacterium]